MPGRVSKKVQRKPLLRNPIGWVEADTDEKSFGVDIAGGDVYEEHELQSQMDNLRSGAKTVDKILWFCEHCGGTKESKMTNKQENDLRNHESVGHKCKSKNSLCVIGKMRESHLESHYLPVTYTCKTCYEVVPDPQNHLVAAHESNKSIFTFDIIPTTLSFRAQQSKFWKSDVSPHFLTENLAAKFKMAEQLEFLPNKYNLKNNTANNAFYGNGSECRFCDWQNSNTNIQVGILRKIASHMREKHTCEMKFLDIWIGIQCAKSGKNSPNEADYKRFDDFFTHNFGNWALTGEVHDMPQSEVMQTTSFISTRFEQIMDLPDNEQSIAWMKLGSRMGLSIEVK